MNNQVKLNHTTQIIGTNQTVGDYWSWAYSNLLAIVNRSIFAEFLVASALGITDKLRLEWNAYDLMYQNKRIEVKSASYLQVWNHNGTTKIQFDIGKKRSYFAETNTYAKECSRCSDIYVFCLFSETNIELANPLDTKQWQFYLQTTEFINNNHAEEKLLKYQQVIQNSKAIAYDQLKSEIDNLIN